MESVPFGDIEGTVNNENNLNIIPSPKSTLKNEIILNNNENTVTRSGRLVIKPIRFRE